MRNNAQPLPPEVIRVANTVSTNSYIRDLLKKQPLPEGSIVIADFQTAGRGQTGNSWESENGKNLTFSIVIYPETIAANEQFLISQVAALSVKKVLNEYTGHIRVKWPNDIYWNDRKICGMLIENDLAGSSIYCSVCGIGININQKEFVSNAPNPVSLTQITGQEYDLQEVLTRFRHHFYQLYLELLQDKKESIRRQYKNALYRGEGFHPYTDENGTFDAEIKDIEPTGHLILRLIDGETRRYAFKEVAIK
ncbi:biotin--[acetyl-CoA-carboxylase] ligase [Massilibacteroides vaginae]|uniref:biotin--[acetyl-CoA-carboxylase] ligase n=1 Tax=Massilibacteroides vaginae TaxID=1673718 RepID=UPI000A1CD8C3|nr:biotin--[acetyl-CoA-carboxylase] ligase [Massilibacteroides vaginae]